MNTILYKKAPVKNDPWKDSVLDGFNFGNDCIQPNTQSGGYMGSEDCLYLNVFAPAQCFKWNKKLSVIVYVFGGKYSAGSARFYGPDFLIDENVTVVIDLKI